MFFTLLQLLGLALVVAGLAVGFGVAGTLVGAGIAAVYLGLAGEG